MPFDRQDQHAITTRCKEAVYVKTGEPACLGSKKGTSPVSPLTQRQVVGVGVVLEDLRFLGGGLTAHRAGYTVGLIPFISLGKMKLTQSSQK